MGSELTDLRIYLAAEELATVVWTAAAKWDRFAKNTVGEQCVRSADSVGANIAEAHGRFHYGQRLQFLYYARGSLYETRHWLRLAYRRQLLDQETTLDMAKKLDALALGLNSFIKWIKDQKDTQTLKETPEYYDTTAPITNLPVSNLVENGYITPEELQWLTNLTENEF